MMEVDGRASCCNDNTPSETSIPLTQQKKVVECSTGNFEFISHAAIAWEESRRKWIGDQSRKSDRSQEDPTLSWWSTTYEDLLSTNDPFPKPIPLPEMVNFLVDIWEDEGLFD